MAPAKPPSPTPPPPGPPPPEPSSPEPPPPGEPPTDVVWPEAFHRLREDPVFGEVVRRVGPVRMPRERLPLFPYLVRAIVHQQLAGKAAATIHARVEGVLGGTPTPEGILAISEVRLREAGLSRNKLAAVRDLAARVEGGVLELDPLETLPDEEVVERLVTVRGIGPWTARMLLLFRLRRPDVWPVGDLGVRAGWGRLHGMDPAPSAAELGPLGDPHRPWRSAVAWYCWRALEA
jgi:DNA-3-methyladenine glycosylase II